MKPAPISFARTYEEYFDFVWRTASRLGVPQSAVADVCQDVFIVVYRRLPEFEARAALKTWLYEIVRRVVGGYRAKQRRKALDQPDSIDPDALPASRARPEEDAATAQKLRLLHCVLDGMDDDKRELFVLSELEQWTVPEIAKACALNINTVYTRLRAARAQFEQGMKRCRAQDSRSKA